MKSLNDIAKDSKVPYQGEAPSPKSFNHPDLRIIVVVYNRPQPLERLLNSLNEAQYFKHNVELEVWIDRSKKDGSIHNATYYAASKFKFLHGEYKVSSLLIYM